MVWQFQKYLGWNLWVSVLLIALVYRESPPTLTSSEWKVEPFQLVRRATTLPCQSQGSSLPCRCTCSSPSYPGKTSFELESNNPRVPQGQAYSSGCSTTGYLVVELAWSGKETLATLLQILRWYQSWTFIRVDSSGLPPAGIWTIDYLQKPEA